jgi:hypothetical protein
MSLRRTATAALILSLVLTSAHGLWAIQAGAQEGAAATTSNATGGAVTPEYRGLGPGQPGWPDCPYGPDGPGPDGTPPHWGWWDDDEDEDVF